MRVRTGSVSLPVSAAEAVALLDDHTQPEHTLSSDKLLTSPAHTGSSHPGSSSVCSSILSTHPRRTILLGLSPAGLRVVRALPLVAAAAWLGTLSTLLAIWGFVDNFERYQQVDAHLTYVSHVGGRHPAVFLTGCVATGACWSAACVVERSLRYEHLLGLPRGPQSRAGVVIGPFDLLLVSVGGCCLALVGAFNAFTDLRAHNLATCLFAVSLCTSSLLRLVELALVFPTHPSFARPRRALRPKAGMLAAATVLLLLYELLNDLCPDARLSTACWRMVEASAGSEWAVCYLAGAYLLSLAWEAWPGERYQIEIGEG